MERYRAENWTLVDGTLIQGELLLPRAAYGTLSIDNFDNNTLSFVELGNLDIEAGGSTVTIDTGCHWITVVDATDSLCRDSVEVCFGDVVAAISGDTASCTGSTVTLTATGGTDYVWSTGATTPSIDVDVTATTTVSVVVSSDQFCGSDSVSHTITATAAPDTVMIDTTICGGSVVTIGGTDYSVAGQYTITLAGSVCDSIIALDLEIEAVDTVEIDTTICEGSVVSIDGTDYSVAGQYTITLAGATCDSVIALDLSIDAAPTPSINTGDTTICGDEAITLIASGGVSYLWSTGDTTASISVQPSSTTDYGVLVTNAAGCQAGTSVTVTVDTSICKDCDFLAADTLGCADIGPNGEVCLPFSRSDILLGNYLVFVDGVPYLDFPGIV